MTNPDIWFVLAVLIVWNIIQHFSLRLTDQKAKRLEWEIQGLKKVNEDLTDRVYNPGKYKR